MSANSSEEMSTTESIVEPTSRRPHFQFMPQFEHSSYDFMVPEGSNPVSTNLAVISYMGQKGTPAPVFKISFDRMRWFEIGNIVRKELDNYVEYKVMINQRADVYVQDSLTKNGSYKFTIEAHDGGTMHTTNIRVDVLALSPKIRRSSTTSTTSATSTLPPETSKAPLEGLQTTTPLLTTTTVSDMSSTGTEAETSSSSSGHVSKEMSTTVESDESEEDTTTAESSTEQRTSPFVTMESMLTTVTESASSTEALSLSTDSGTEEIIDRALSDLLQTTSTEIIERNATSSSKEATTTDTSVEVASVEVSSLESDPNSQVQGKSTRVHLMSESAENRLLNSNSNEDVDDNDEKEEEDVKEVEEKSLSAPVVKEGSGGEPEPISSTASSDEEDEEIEVIVDGAVNGTFQAETLLRDGDLLRGLTVSVKITPKRKNSYTKLSVDRVDAVDIKPKLLYSGSKAYLFVKNSSALNDPLMIKIMAERPNAASIKEIIVMGTPKKQARIEKPRKAVEEYVFSVPEDSLSGTTVGQIKDGESKRVVGPSGLFSLLGSDLILSCPDENGCLDYEKEQMHHVLLVDAQGRKSRPIYVKIKVEDVNDNVPRLEASDSFIRMSNNKLIMPFIVQVLDEDEPLSNKNHLTLSNSAASFLALKEIAPNLYQVDVVGFAPGGHHQLDVTVSDEKSSSSLTIEVEVQNSHSRAHFRRSKYSRSITADKVHHGNQLVQVELEGVPIDEARFVILQGNPGWLSIDDYGGRVGVAKLLSPVESGNYLVEIGAVDRQSNALLAQTQLEIKVVGGAESEKTAFTRNLYKRTLDRETSAVFSVPFKMQKEGLVSVESVLAIDENGQKVDFKKSDVSIERHSIIFKKATLAGLRAVSVGLISEREEATAMLLLTSSAEFIEDKKKESARPIFPNPWTRAAPVIELSIPEELPLGHVIYSLPAVNPVDGSLVPLRVSGEMKDFFNVDSLTGTISIARLLDADTLPKDDRTFSLKLSAGSIGYESMAELKVTVVNIDDNAPILEKDGLNNEVPIPENLPPSTMIARLEIRDIDGLGSVDEFSVEKSGIGSELYSASIKNGSLVVSVADNATLDREVMERQTIHLIVGDPAGHQDSVTIHVLLLDENDNPPRFLRDQYEMQVVDNWPTGIVVERLTAVDRDVGKNARVTYSLAPGSTKYFSINPSNGELSVSGELAGAARDQPYELTIVAEDSGNPSLSTSMKAKVRINEPLLEKEGEKGQVHFINPPVEFVLKLKEDTPVNEHVYAVKARLAGMTTERANIKYSLKDFSNSLQHFDIDESSGEVYVSKPLDYEQRKFFTVSFFSNFRSYVALTEVIFAYTVTLPSLFNTQKPHILDEG
ncbi:hypothetical protein Q1695_006042 [Nippostrongylus brasiliensis]|nr:hypothetical protein Q1695_006042 [Nippostrongylus brasiliensis]